MQLNLEYHLSRYRVLLDHRCLTDDASRAFICDMLAPVAKRLGKPIVLGATGNAEVAKAGSSSALAAIRIMRSQGTIEIMGGPTFSDGEKELLEVVRQYHSQRSLLVITQDDGLAQHVWNAAPSATGKQLILSQIREGVLHDRRKPNPGDRVGRKTTGEPDPVQFRRTTNLVETPPRIVSASEAPVVGNQLSAEGYGTVQLVEQIGGGGEAKVYAINLPELVAKVYLPGKLTDHTLAKLERMCAARVAAPSLCWPKAVLRNSRGEPVGYLMPRAAGRPLARSVFIRPALRQHFPNWHRSDLAKVAINISEAVELLHRMNVVLGDINASNILVREDGGVSLVDLDSAQIEGYPCPVGTPDFTRATNQGKPFNSYLRDFDDDRFALSIMLFMVLMPGRHPFSHRGGERPRDNIRTGLFPYPFGGRGGEHVPDGDWRNIWSHFSYKLQQAFFECFSDGNLKTAGEWGVVLRRYLKAIEGGRMDPDGGNDIFPIRRKRVSEEVQAKFGFKQQELLAFTCISCTKPFEMPARSLAGRPTPSQCPNCRKAEKLSAERAEQSSVRARRPVLSQRTSRATTPPRPNPPQPPPRTAQQSSRPAGPGDGLLLSLIKLIIGRK